MEEKEEKWRKKKERQEERLHPQHADNRALEPLEVPSWVSRGPVQFAMCFVFQNFGPIQEVLEVEAIPVFGSVPATPDPSTSARVSRYKWEPYRDAKWWCICYFLQRGWHPFAEVSR